MCSHRDDVAINKFRETNYSIFFVGVIKNVKGVIFETELLCKSLQSLSRDYIRGEIRWSVDPYDVKLSLKKTL